MGRQVRRGIAIGSEEHELTWWMKIEQSSNYDILGDLEIFLP